MVIIYILVTLSIAQLVGLNSFMIIVLRNA